MKNIKSKFLIDLSYFSQHLINTKIFYSKWNFKISKNFQKMHIFWNRKISTSFKPKSRLIFNGWCLLRCLGHRWGIVLKCRWCFSEKSSNFLWMTFCIKNFQKWNGFVVCLGPISLIYYFFPCVVPDVRDIGGLIDKSVLIIRHSFGNMSYQIASLDQMYVKVSFAPLFLSGG